MGVYVYTMRATKRNVEIDGTKVEANLLSFAFKPYWSSEQPPLFNRILTRAENFWDARQTPNVFVVGDKFEDGCEVRKNWPDGRGSCYDTPKFPGEHLGYLKKVGRTWKVVPTEGECYGV